MEDPPERVLYKSLYPDEAQEEQGAGTYIFIALCCIFVIAVLGCSYEVLRSARRDRKRRRAGASGANGGSATGSPSASQRWQTPYTESAPPSTGVKSVGFKAIVVDEKRPNGTHAKPIPKDYKPVSNTEVDLINGKKVLGKGEPISPHIQNLLIFYFILFICNQRIYFTADEEPEKKELLGVNTGTTTKPAKLNPFVKIF